MEEKKAGSSREIPEDDVEKKIRVLEAELATVSSKGDKKISWGVFGLCIFIISYKLLQFNPIIFIIVIPTVVVGGIAMVINENIQVKKKILIEHGLKCCKCGHIPSFINASGLYYSQQCQKCHANLKI